MEILGANKQMRYAVITRFLTIFIPMFFLLAAGGTAHYYTEMKLAQINQSTNEENQIAIAKKAITSELHSVISDLSFLTKLNELWDILDGSIGDAQRERARSLAAQEFLYFSEKKGVYDQISFLGLDGDEVIRVNYGDGHPYIVEQSALKNIADRNYFKQAFAQDLGGIYMSPFEIENDHEPNVGSRTVIRFATPLLDSLGNKRGVLMISFRGDKLLWSFVQVGSDVIDHMHLLNPEGAWLFDPHNPGELNNFSTTKARFADAYPLEWQEILNQDNGSLITPNGLFTFTTVYPAVSVLELYSKSETGGVSSVVEGSANATPRFWKIVSVVSPTLRGTLVNEFLRKHFWLYVFMLFFLGGGSWFIAHKSVKIRLAQAHAEYERRFRQTLENIQLCAVTLDPQGNVVFCNDYLLTLLGWSRKELLGRNWFDAAIHKEHRQDERSHFADIIVGNQPPLTSETALITKYGAMRYFTWNNMLSFSPSGELSGLTSIGQDITEQKKTERQLHKLSLAVNQTQESILITNERGVIELVNPGFTQLSGYSENEVLGRTWEILTSHDTNDAEHDELRRSILKGEIWQGVLRDQRKNGEYYWASIVISPIRNEHGDIIHFLVIQQDVTEHRRLREEVEARNLELARAQNLATMGRMATMIAHDLRNPLSSIKMTLQILKKNALINQAAETNELPAIALDQVRYMEDILAGLLLYSQPDALTLDWLNINKIIDNAISSTQKLIQDTSAKIVTHYQEQLPTLHCDATKLRQVFCNLIINAIQSTEGLSVTPEVTIRTKLEVGAPELAIRIEICDNGCGLAAEDIENLFEPFVTTRAKGTGLGLSIVKKMVEQHHGKIYLAPNESGGGACAIVILPIRPLG